MSDPKCSVCGSPMPDAEAVFLHDCPPSMRRAMLLLTAVTLVFLLFCSAARADCIASGDTVTCTLADLTALDHDAITAEHDLAVCRADVRLRDAQLAAAHVHVVAAEAPAEVSPWPYVVAGAVGVVVGVVVAALIR